MPNYNGFEFFTLCNRNPSTYLAQDAIWCLLRLLHIGGLLSVGRQHEAIHLAVEDTWRFLAGSDVAPDEIKQWVEESEQ